MVNLAPRQRSGIRKRHATATWIERKDVKSIKLKRRTVHPPTGAWFAETEREWQVRDDFDKIEVYSKKIVTEVVLA